MPTSSRFIDLLPLYARMLDEPQMLEHWANAVQPQIDSILQRLDLREVDYNVDVTTSQWLDHLGQFVGLAVADGNYLGIGLNPAWPDEHKRNVIRRANAYFARKGTDWGIREGIALWLMWEAAHDPERLVIRLPFGEVGANAYPDQWWHYGTSYDTPLSQTYIEKQQFGGGDYEQLFTPQEITLSTPASHWYGEEWSDRILRQDDRPTVITQGSGLGSQRPWMHCFLTESEWNLVFPNLLKLNFELWNTHANPEVFGWLSYRLRFPLILEEAQGNAQYDTVEVWEPDGQQYYDLWYFAARDTAVETQSTEETVFGIAPGHGYTDDWNALQTPTPDNYLYYRPDQEITIESTATQVIPASCLPVAVDAEIVDGYETKAVGGQDAIPPTQQLERFNPYRYTIESSWNWSNLAIDLAGNPTIPLLEFGIMPIAVASLSFDGVAAIDLDIALDVAQLRKALPPIDVAFNVDVPAIEVPLILLTNLEHSYRWIPPIDVHIFDSLWEDGAQYYYAGQAAKRGEVEQIPILKTVKLCNYQVAYSTRNLLRYDLQKIQKPIDTINLFDLYPILEKVSIGNHWKLLVEADIGLFILLPVTMFWSQTVGSGATEGDRSQVPTIDTGYLNLYLEFVFHPSSAGKLRSLTLLLDGEVVQVRSFEGVSDRLNLSAESAFAVRFVVPLRFPSGAATLADHLAIEEYANGLLGQLEMLMLQLTTRAAENRDRDTLLGISALEHLPRFMNPLPTMESLKVLLGATNTALELFNTQLSSRQYERLILRLPLTLNLATAQEGVGYQSIYTLSTGLGHQRFAVGQIRSVEPPYDRYTPDIEQIGLDSVRLTFWSAEPITDELEVWIYRSHSDSDSSTPST